MDPGFAIPVPAMGWGGGFPGQEVVAPSLAHGLSRPGRGVARPVTGWGVIPRFARRIGTPAQTWGAGQAWTGFGITLFYAWGEGGCAAREITLPAMDWGDWDAAGGLVGVVVPQAPTDWGDGSNPAWATPVTGIAWGVGSVVDAWSVPSPLSVWGYETGVASSFSIPGLNRGSSTGLARGVAIPFRHHGICPRWGTVVDPPAINRRRTIRRLGINAGLATGWSFNASRTVATTWSLFLSRTASTTWGGQLSARVPTTWGHVYPVTAGVDTSWGCSSPISQGIATRWAILDTTQLSRAITTTWQVRDTACYRVMTDTVTLTHKGMQV